MSDAAQAVTTRSTCPFPRQTREDAFRTRTRTWTWHWFPHHPRRWGQGINRRGIRERQRAEVMTQAALINEVEMQLQTKGRRRLLKNSESNLRVGVSNLATKHPAWCGGDGWLVPFCPLLCNLSPAAKTLCEQVLFDSFFFFLGHCFHSRIHVSTKDNWNAQLHIQDPKWRNTARILDCSSNVYSVFFCVVQHLVSLQSICAEGRSKSAPVPIM